MLKAKIRSLLKKFSRFIIHWKNRFMFQEILILGDSHTRVFRSDKFKSYFPKHLFNVVTVGGCTVSGLKNPNSKTQALSIFMDNLKKSTAKTTIVLLGEVDVGFIIWYRAEKYNTPTAAMLEKAIENYQKLLKEISKKSRVICLSAPLPTIQDGNDWGEVANARKNIKATQRQRTELTLLFNKQMQEFCTRNRFLYLSFDNESIGKDGFVTPHLLNLDKTDHHYDDDKYADMIINRLKEHINR